MTIGPAVLLCFLGLTFYAGSRRYVLSGLDDISRRPGALLSEGTGPSVARAPPAGISGGGGCDGYPAEAAGDGSGPGTHARCPSDLSVLTEDAPGFPNLKLAGSGDPTLLPRLRAFRSRDADRSHSHRSSVQEMLKAGPGDPVEIEQVLACTPAPETRRLGMAQQRRDEQNWSMGNDCR